MSRRRPVCEPGGRQAAMSNRRDEGIEERSNRSGQPYIIWGFKLTRCLTYCIAYLGSLRVIVELLVNSI